MLTGCLPIDLKASLEKELYQLKKLPDINDKEVLLDAKELHQNIEDINLKIKVEKETMKLLKIKC